MGTSYLSPGLRERGCPKGVGTFAVEPFRKGAVLAVFGGDVLTREALEQCPPERKANSVQITADLYLVPSSVGPGDHINHRTTTSSRACAGRLCAGDSSPGTIGSSPRCVSGTGGISRPM